MGYLYYLQAEQVVLNHSHLRRYDYFHKDEKATSEGQANKLVDKFHLIDL